jgi:hypothetical protein
MRAISLAIMFLWGGVAEAAEITGLIRHADGQPIAGATIQVSTAHLRTGSSPMCPSCWLDCAKSAKSDASGKFRIPDVSDKLVFRLLALADGFAPSYIDNVDPAIGPAAATLQVRDLSSFTEAQMIRGTITGDEGRPIAGATVSPLIPQDGLDSVALTNLNGEFALTSSNKVEKNVLEIRAEGYLMANVDLRNGLPKLLNVKLRRGVVVTGRVLQNGKPVEGVTMGARQIDRSSWSLDSIEAVTGPDGAFKIWCVPPNDKVAVYSTMESFAGKGATPLRVIDTGADETTFDLGDLEVQKAGRLTGWLHLTDGRTFPPETRINLGRNKAWDSILIDVRSDGHFEAQNIPLEEEFTLFLPDDYQVQAVSQGFSVDDYRRYVKGTLKRELTELKVDLAWKDAATQEKEQFETWVRKEHRDFIESAKLNPEQVPAFISVKRDGMKVWEDACKQDEIPPGILHEEFEARELTKRLGEKYHVLFQQYESLKSGRVYLDQFSRLHEGAWLDDEEKKRLAPLVALELDKAGKHWRAHYWTKASLQEKIEVTTRMYEGIYTVCAAALPPPKVKILRKCLDDFQRRQLDAIRDGKGGY